jgi:cell division protein FtsI/penicillin-binding protein 2
MGKTGTANLAMNGSYSKDHLIFTFAGIVQKGNYNRVIVTCIKNVKNAYKKYGANTAAPLFEKIAEKMLVHDKVVID